MPTSAPAAKKNGRRAILDLAPLELDCLLALWPLEEATVRQVRDAMAARKPRAYTTVMTILDRMAQKGLVERRKQGRAYLYRPVLTLEEARSDAVAQLVEHFFGGSAGALAAHLAGTPVSAPRERPRPVLVERPASSPRGPRASRKRAASPEEPPSSPPPLDTTLL